MKKGDKPTLKLLTKYKGEIAPHWYDVGIQLLQEQHIYKLEIIQNNYPNDIEKRCGEMFKYWLSVDVEANWNKLIDALDLIQLNTTVASIRQDILIDLPAPNNVRAAVSSHSSVEVTWDQLFGATQYTISYSTIHSQRDSKSVTVKGDSTTSYTLKNLDQNTPYTITVQATSNDGRKSALSSEVLVTTHVAAPSLPPYSIIITSADPASLTVSWQPPLEQSRNVPITGYMIQYIKDGSQDKTNEIEKAKVNSGTTHTISGLVACTKYSVKIAAMFIDRIGPFSEAVVKNSGEDTPTKPCSLKVASVTSTSVTLQWMAPETPNGHITKYSIQYNGHVFDNFGVIRCNKMVGTVEGLSADAEYALQLRAHTRVGPGPSVCLTVKTELDTTRTRITRRSCFIL